MNYDDYINPKTESGLWSVRIIRQGIVAFHEMEEVKGELERVAEFLVSGNTAPAYTGLRFLEARAERAKKHVTTVFAISLRGYLEYLKDQTLEVRTLGVAMMCRTLRLILTNAPEHGPGIVEMVAPQSVGPQHLEVSRRCIRVQLVA